MRRYDAVAMELTLIIGLTIVGVGGLVGGFIVFGHRTNSLADVTASTSTALAGSERTGLGAGLPRTQPVTTRWYQRIRSGVVLLLITIGFGTIIGAVIGAFALGASLVLD